MWQSAAALSSTDTLWTDSEAEESGWTGKSIVFVRPGSDWTGHFLPLPGHNLRPFQHTTTTRTVPVNPGIGPDKLDAQRPAPRSAGGLPNGQHQHAQRNRQAKGYFQVGDA